MSDTTVWYSVSDDDCRWELTVKGAWDMNDEFDAESVAEECAEDFHSNHDGWEYRWPLTIKLWADEDRTPALAIVDVERDMEPVFRGHVAKPAKPNADAPQSL